MKMDSYLLKLAQYLARLGFTWRSLVLFALFLLTFFISTFGFVLTQNWDNILIYLLIMTPLEILIILLLYLILNRRLKLKELILKVNDSSMTETSLKQPSIKTDLSHKMKIAVACFATSIAIAAILAVLLIFIGMEDMIEIFFIFYWTLGLVAVFSIFWPFYSKKLRS